jgi:putative phosphoribosyl transferase
MGFENRRAAGRLLAAQLCQYAGKDGVVLGVSRGGAVVAHEVARALHLPLDVLVVHKIDEPGCTHAHLGVVAEPRHLVVNRQRLRALGLESTWLEGAVAQGVQEVSRRGAAYRGARAREKVVGRRVIVVDDAAGTGATLRAAVKAVRAMGPCEIIVAIPVAPRRVVEGLRPQVDRVVCLATPGDLIWHGIYYPQRGEVTDDDIGRLLKQEAATAVRADVHGPRERRRRDTPPVHERRHRPRTMLST